MPDVCERVMNSISGLIHWTRIPMETPTRNRRSPGTQDATARDLADIVSKERALKACMAYRAMDASGLHAMCLQGPVCMPCVPEGCERV